ncbi:head-tail connector protein [Phreatobacter sp.]|uniref:head-tail connector protein n=1 Tax=Phreatobacter sp. TaxID=1966341 RepID=UPI003F7289F3
MPDVAVSSLVPFCTLADLKLQLRVESNEEDNLILLHLEAATQQIIDIVGDTPVPEEKAPLFRAAAVIIVTDRFENRGGTQMATGLPRAAEGLLAPYRNLRV